MIMAGSRCEVCGQLKDVVVAGVPYIAYSASFCATCLKSNAIPYSLAVSNTAAIGGLQNADDGWKDIVTCTINLLGKSLEEFTIDVSSWQTELPPDDISF
tara:strand:+ start:2404 stop:2703 length:300 start_codon:yes stop_codon:yes gene_type:complete